MVGNYRKNVKDSIKRLEEEEVISPKTAAFLALNSEKDILVPDASDYKYDPVFTQILIDKSSSMTSCKDDVLIAHREMIKALRESAITRHGAHFISQYLFDADISLLGKTAVLGTEENTDEVILLDNKNYIPDGKSTALYRSLKSVLQDIITKIEDARFNGSYPKVTIGIITDGEDTDGGIDPAEIRSCIQELKDKKYLRSSVVVGLKSSDSLNDETLENIKTRLGFDESIPCDKSDSRGIREAFRTASQSLVAKLPQ